MKLLYITNITNGVSSFSKTAVLAARQNGFEVFLAGNFEDTPKEKLLSDEEKFGVHFCSVNLSRNPYSIQNKTALNELVDFIKKEKIDVIHCNTPVGGLLGRLAGTKCGVKKIIYQAHGFHFYKGAPLKNWLLYYPIEKMLARKTDAIITINSEDFKRASEKFSLRNNGKVYFVPGVGMDLSDFRLPEDVRNKKREELSLKSTDIAVISMGDLIKRKDYETAVNAMAKCRNEKIHYFICGEGPEEEKLKNMAKASDANITFLGFREDIKELLKAADIFLLTSRQEGLARSLMEAMASALCCVASDIRGNCDLIENNGGNFLCQTADEFAEALNLLSADETLRNSAAKINAEKIKMFSSERVIKALSEIYKTLCGE